MASVDQYGDLLRYDLHFCPEFLFFVNKPPISHLGAGGDVGMFSVRGLVLLALGAKRSRECG